MYMASPGSTYQGWVLMTLELMQRNKECNLVHSLKVTHIPHMLNKHSTGKKNTTSPHTTNWPNLEQQWLYTETTQWKIS